MIRQFIWNTYALSVQNFGSNVRVIEKVSHVVVLGYLFLSVPYSAEIRVVAAERLGRFPRRTCQATILIG